MAREYRRYRVMTILRIKNEGYWRITVGKRYLSWNPTNTFRVIPWGKRGRFWYWLHFHKERE